MTRTLFEEFSLANPLSTVQRALLVSALAVSVAGVARPAFAYDDGYQNVFTSVLTAVGVVPADKSPEIDYRERPPLVLPPQTTLAKPEAPGAGRSAAWPQDPDVVRRHKEAEDAKSPVGLLEKNDRPLSKEEMLRYRAAESHVDVDPSGCDAFEHSMAKCRPNPEEMKAEEKAFRAANPEKTNAVTAGVEPERLYLTQPPRGYLKSTKTVAATHEAPVKQHDTSNPLSTYIHPAEKNIDPLNN